MTYLEAEVQSIGSQPVTRGEGWSYRGNLLMEVAQTHGYESDRRRLCERPHCARLAPKDHTLCSVCYRQSRAEEVAARDAAQGRTMGVCTVCTTGKVKPAQWRQGVRRCPSCRGQRQTRQAA